MQASRMMWGLVLGACLAGGSLMAMAQQSEGMNKPMDAQQAATERLHSMANQLQLTDDQKTKLKPLITSEAEEMQALRKNTSLSPQDRRKQMAEVHEKYEPQINAVLTPEQQAKWKAMKKQAWEEHKEKMGGGSMDKPQ